MSKCLRSVAILSALVGSSALSPGGFLAARLASRRPWRSPEPSRVDLGSRRVSPAGPHRTLAEGPQPALTAVLVPAGASLRASARRCAVSLGLAALSWRALGESAFASVGAGAPAAGAPLYAGPLWVPACMWLSLFGFSSGLHAAEISITTLYPWKVREFAEDEGPNSPFAYLNKDITRVLTTILVLTTMSQVVSTVLFTTVVSQIESVSFSQATLALTAVTLFFGELLPKAIGVSNPEMVARTFVPVLSVLAVFMAPVAIASKFMINKIVQVLGLKGDDEGRVSEDELRLMIMGAKQSGGIETEEAKMVEGVLDLQDMRVSEVMRPRINIAALEANATLCDFLLLVNRTKYSRIPVYVDDIDNIAGVAIAKDLLIYAMQPELHNTTKVGSFMEPTYFVPESMRVQSVLEEMRKRRLHMAIVVDEYGGTAGVVTLEDILEEVVGEIYDEGDYEEEEIEVDNINLMPDGSFELKGVADLEDVTTALGIQIKKDEDSARDFGTVSGFLCDQAGEIPMVGDVLVVDCERVDPMFDGKRGGDGEEKSLAYSFTVGLVLGGWGSMPTYE
mmetsp:Transcript_29694/g.66593  ORF Transcript_29694/g.66593 Transcript_29694/m.66593 type:complete len:564 (+) Transcript_29694:136-1827(+)